MQQGVAIAVGRGDPLGFCFGKALLGAGIRGLHAVGDHEGQALGQSVLDAVAGNMMIIHGTKLLHYFCEKKSFNSQIRTSRGREAGGSSSRAVSRLVPGKADDQVGVAANVDLVFRTGLTPVGTCR